MTDENAIKEAKWFVERMKNEALQLGRLRTRHSPLLADSELDYAWKHRGGAFRCMAYNSQIRAINAVERLISIGEELIAIAVAG